MQLASASGEEHLEHRVLVTQTLIDLIGARLPRTQRKALANSPAGRFQSWRHAPTSTAWQRDGDSFTQLRFSAPMFLNPGFMPTQG